MIAFLKGRTIEKQPTFVIIETHGVGYQVYISLHTFAELKDQETIQLFTYLHVREDAHILYGFSQQAEKAMFQNLISVNGIGPGTAVMVLSCLSTAELHAAIVEDRVEALQHVKGIGKKTAQRIILELKDRLQKEPMGTPSQIVAKKHNTIQNEALKALMTLGLNKAVAERSINAVMKKSPQDISLEELVKLALKGV